MEAGESRESENANEAGWAEEKAAKKWKVSAKTKREAAERKAAKKREGAERKAAKKREGAERKARKKKAPRGYGGRAKGPDEGGERNVGGQAIGREKGRKRCRNESPPGIHSHWCRR